MKKHRHALTAVQNPTFDLDGACVAASADSTTLTFTNHRPKARHHHRTGRPGGLR